jgi:hypothetical protein
MNHVYSFFVYLWSRDETQGLTHARQEQGLHPMLPSTWILLQVRDGFLLKIPPWSLLMHPLTIYWNLVNKNPMKKFFFFLQYWGLNPGFTTGATPPALFCERCFWDRVPWTIFLGWLQTTIILISASWVVRITGVSHGRPEPMRDCTTSLWNVGKSLINGRRKCLVNKFSS